MVLSRSITKRALAGGAGLFVVLLATPAHAAGWPVPADPATSTSRADGAPAAPVSATSACLSGTSSRVVVTWAPVAAATSYTLESAPTSGATFATLAAGITSTTYTTPELAVATYVFRVRAVLGTYWAGPPSPVTSPRTVVVALTCQ